METRAVTASPASSFAFVGVGDPAPWFHQRSTSNPRYSFDSAAGRYILMCFFGSTDHPAAGAALAAVHANRHFFDDSTIAFFGITSDPRDESESRVRAAIPGRRFIFDTDLLVSRLYGAVPQNAEPGSPDVPLRQFWLLLDPTMRVIARFPFAPHGAEQGQLFAHLRRLPPPERFAGQELQAPVLFLPNAFEPALCRRLIEVYEEQGGKESGFMRDIDGRTLAVHDASHKRRKDHEICDEELKAAIRARVQRRLVPEIAKAHQYHVTLMERYLVACYAAEDGGHFRAHRDNTTKGTAHRRFAASINLNAEFDGGEVSFPEYGPRSFKPPPGGAVVFSCSLLHAVSRVTAGRRFAFLPFLYDDAAGKIRDANYHLLGPGPVPTPPSSA